MEPLRVGVLGLGLIGSSAARGLRAVTTVRAFDPDQATRLAAEDSGIDVVGRQEDLADSDVLLLAAPTRVNSRLLTGLGDSGFARPVADFGSVKMPIEQVWLQGGAALRFVGTHPMAGSESAGFAAGTADLFAEAAWPVVVHPATDPEALVTVLRLIVALGARPLPVSASAHDDAVAWVSHLPHLLAGALGQAGSTATHLRLAARLAGGSFRDASRVSASPPARSAEFLVVNGPAAARMARAAARALDEAAGILEAGDEAAALDWLIPAHGLRAAFVRRWSDTVAHRLTGNAEAVHAGLLQRRDSGCGVVGIGGGPGQWQIDLAVPTPAPGGGAVADG